MRPISIDVYLTYKCPYCEYPNNVILEAAQYYDALFCTMCRKKFEIDTISKFSLVYKRVEKSEPELDDYINMLVSMGYTKKEAKEKIEEYKDLLDNKDEFLKAILC